MVVSKGDSISVSKLPLANDEFINIEKIIKEPIMKYLLTIIRDLKSFKYINISILLSDYSWHIFQMSFTKKNYIYSVTSKLHLQVITVASYFIWVLLKKLHLLYHFKITQEQLTKP